MGEAKVVEEPGAFERLAWDEVYCTHCPMWDPFPFASDCEAGCGEKHEGEKGLCRNKPPVGVRSHDGQGVWPVTNNDDWCADGRFAVQDMQAGLAEDLAKK
jgi:hypothetical protein